MPQFDSLSVSVGISRPTVFPNPARKHVFPLTSGRTRVNGSRGVSRVTAGRAANASAATDSSDDRGDAVTRASMGSKVQASHRSSDAALSPQSRSRRTYSRNDPVPVAFACESGGFRERRRRPSTLEPATSHAPRSHVVSAIREITRDRQRAGIRGGLEGPNGESEAFSGTTEVSVVAARRRESFSDARRESTPCPEMGNGALSSDMDACRERGGTSVVGTVAGECDWRSSEEAHGSASGGNGESCRQVRREDEVVVEEELSEGRDTRKNCTTGPAVRMRAKVFDWGAPQRVHGLHGAAQMRRTFSAPYGSSRTAMQEPVLPSQSETMPASVAAAITRVRTLHSSTVHA